MPTESPVQNMGYPHPLCARDVYKRQLLPGADTVGRGLKELAEKSIVYKSETSDKSICRGTKGIKRK